jgi:hypothetical protein
MTRQEALAFLRVHPPLPPDDLLSDEPIADYEEVRKLDRPRNHSHGMSQ